MCQLRQILCDNEEEEPWVDRHAAGPPPHWPNDNKPTTDYEYESEKHRKDHARCRNENLDKRS